MAKSEILAMLKAMQIQVENQILAIQQKIQQYMSPVGFRFGTSIYEDRGRNLSNLTQTTTVAKFQSDFEKLMNKETWISESLQISYFISGLKPDLHLKLLFNLPTTLMEAYSLASAYEASVDEVTDSPSMEVLTCSTAIFPVSQSVKVEETLVGAEISADKAVKHDEDKA